MGSGWPEEKSAFKVTGRSRNENISERRKSGLNMVAIVGLTLKLSGQLFLLGLIHCFQISSNLFINNWLPFFFPKVLHRLFRSRGFVYILGCFSQTSSNSKRLRILLICSLCLCSLLNLLKFSVIYTNV